MPRSAITRMFDASRERVFKAWTDPDDVAEWFSPAPLTTPRDSVRIDLRVGGRYELTMVMPDGAASPLGFEIVELDLPGCSCSAPTPCRTRVCPSRPSCGSSWRRRRPERAHETRMTLTDGPYPTGFGVHAERGMAERVRQAGFGRRGVAPGSARAGAARLAPTSRPAACSWANLFDVQWFCRHTKPVLGLTSDGSREPDRAPGGAADARALALRRAVRAGQPLRGHGLRGRPQHHRPLPRDAGRVRGRWAWPPGSGSSSATGCASSPDIWSAAAGTTGRGRSSGMR